ncbi:MAG: HAD hydrolase-like protein [Planctomycetota bacterium]|nr:HAD hydrolase-like protein [Planctomycetota bacterium]
MKYKAVLFDLDGTLLDTIVDLADAMNVVLARMGFPAHPVEPYKYFVGNGLVNIVRRALPEDSRDEETVALAAAGMSEQYAKHWAEKSRPYDGVRQLLDELAARNIAMAVLSNKPDEFTRQMVAHFFDGCPFSLVFGARPDVPLKPDPAAAIEIAGRLDIPPAEFLYLGDTGTDMQTACAAGCYAVGATWGFRPADELTENGAKTLIKHPAELLELIQRG